MIKKIYIFIVFGICVLYASHDLLAQDPASITYTERDGLISNNIYYVMQDSKGYLWICTDEGVSRFNGQDFVNYGPEEGLDGGGVFICTEDSIGRIWFGCYASKVYYYQDGSIYSYKFNSEVKKKISSECVKTSIYFDSKFNLWLGTRQHGLLRVNGQGVGKMLNSPGGKNILIGKDFSLCFSQRATKPPFANSVTFRVIDKKQKVNVLSKADSDNQLKQPHFYCLKYDSAYFISSHTSLFSYRDGQIKFLKKFDKIIDCIYITKDKDLLVGFVGGGLSLFEDIEDLSIQVPYFNETTVTSVVENKNSEIFLGTFGVGLIEIGNLNIIEFDISEYELTNYVRQDDLLYLSYSEGKLFKFQLDSYKLENLYSIRELRSDFPLYFGVYRNKVIISDNYPCIPNKEIEYLPFEAFHADPKHYVKRGSSIIIAATSRLFEYSENYLIYLEEDLKTIDPDIRITAVSENHSRNLLLGTNRGLFYKKDKEIVKGKFFKNIKSILKTDSDLFVFDHRLGLYKLSHFDTTFQNVPISIENMDIGVVDNSDYMFLDNDSICLFWSLNMEQSVRIDLMFNSKLKELKYVANFNDRLFFVDENSIFVVKNINFFDKSYTLNSPFIKNVKINSKEVSIDKVVDGFSSEYSNFTFKFDFINFLGSRNFYLEHRLWPIEIEWHESTNLEAMYSALEKGKYSLQVRLVSNDFKVKSRILSIPIKVVVSNITYWWISLIAILILSFLSFRNTLGEFNLRINKIYDNPSLIKEKTELKLQLLLARLNPHFTFNALNSLQGMLLDGKKVKSLNFLNDYSRLLRKVMVNSGSPMVLLNDELDLLKRYIEIENIRFDGKIKLEISLPDEIGNKIKIPAMLLQPILENSIKHGFSLEHKEEYHIHVSLSNSTYFYDIVIRDNGVGYSRTQTLKKNGLSQGLKIVKENLEVLHNESDTSKVFAIGDYFKNDEICGTEVRLKIPKQLDNEH